MSKLRLARRLGVTVAVGAALALGGGAAYGGEGADLSVGLPPATSTTPGSDTGISLTARNHGPERAQNVNARVTLTRGAATFVSLAAPAGWSCLTPASGADVEAVSCSIPQLASGWFGEFRLVVRPKASFSGTISVIARVLSSTADPVATNNVSQTELRVVPPADVGVRIDGPPSAPANTFVDYTVSVRNNGPSVAGSVHLRIPIPSQTTYLSVRASPWTCSPKESFEEVVDVVCAGSIGVGGTATATLSVLVDGGASGTITARASVVYGNDPNGANDSAALTHPVTHPRADLGVSVSTVDFTAPGGTINYSLRVTNHGPDIAYLPDISIPIPAQTSVVALLSQSARWGCANHITFWRCGGGTLAPGATADFFFTVRVNAAATGSITFTATASSNSADPNAANDTARAVTTIADAADVGVELTGPATAEPDTDITYTFTVTNHGPGTAREVSVFVEDYPGTFVSMTGADGWECNDPGFGGRSPAGCNAAGLDPGEQVSFELVVHVDPDAADLISNGVTVSSLLDANGANDSASLDTVIGTPPPPGPTAPTAPTQLTATAGSGEVRLAWEAPASDGGSPITGYDVFVGTSTGGQGATPANGDPLSADATGYTVTGLANGQQYFFVVRAVNDVGRSAASNEASTTPFAQTSVVYDGDEIATAGFPFTPAALVSGPAGECAEGSVVTFSLDVNPLLGVEGEYVLGTATADAGGRATAAPVPTGDWPQRPYTITARVEPTPGCAGSSDSATLVVGSVGRSASGAGWYALPDGGRVNVQFRVEPDGAGGHRGTLRVIDEGRWLVRGALSTFVLPEAGRGVASGTGDLFWWNPDLDSGRGDWELAATAVPYTVAFSATGADRRTTPGAFGITIDHTPVGSQPGMLPNSSPQPLGGGKIALD